MSCAARFAVTVYAGSRTRAHGEHLALAAELGSEIAKHGWCWSTAERTWA